jgi:fibro-slime domain-containing protein
MEKLRALRLIIRQISETTLMRAAFGALQPRKPTQTKASDQRFRGTRGNDPSPPSFQQALDAKVRLPARCDESRALRWSLAGLACLSLWGCGSSDTDGPMLGGGLGGASNGSGGSTAMVGSGGAISFPVAGAAGNTGNTGGVGGGECNPQPVGLLRDFRAKMPADFEFVTGDDRGIVANELGADKKPVFAGEGHRTVHTAAEFDQWYRDVPGVNMTTEYKLPFTMAANGNLVYDNQAFFPLDDQGFGNEGRNHNFHFTYELHMEFKYSGGEIFTFRGDDDVFVFVNNKLAIDLGGVHRAETGQLDLDEQAAMLQISPGNTYPIDFFQAERHTTESSFRIETSLQFSNCTPIIVR